MTCCRVLLRSSAGEAWCRSENLSIAHNCYGSKGLVLTSCFRHALSRAACPPGTLNTAVQRRPTVRWGPPLWVLSWARSFYTVPPSQGRYISAEITEAYASSHHEVPAFSASHDPGEENIPSADGDTQMHNEDSLYEEERKADNFFVVNFYVLVQIDDPQLEVTRHIDFMKNKDIRGRILISSQGINAQYSGSQDDVLAYANWVKKDPRFSSIYVQVSPSFDGHAFPRFKLRYKPSLVQVEGGTASLPITDPSSRALPLSPREWKQKLASAQRLNNTEASAHFEKDDTYKLKQRPMLLLDVRNGYEWDIGHFKGAQRPPVDCFKNTEFGLQYNEDNSSDPLANVDKENTDILMYCTGGIRCDIYSALLRQKGFKNLYSLQGGVARYLIEENGENWLGNLFVFDSRLSIPPTAYKQSLDCSKEDSENARSVQGELAADDESMFCKCSLCGGPLSHVRHRNCSNIDCNRLLLCCDQCGSELTGCCSIQCTSAPRQRPYFSSPQQYKRWHNYRDGSLLPRPAGYVGKRAKRRLREQEQKLHNASLDTAESLKGVAAGGS